MILRPALLIFTIVYCISSSAAQDYEQRMDAIFSNYVHEDMPGGAVLVVKDGNVLYQKSWGVSDLNTQDPLTSHSILNTGSISKTFVANGILILHERKKLSINDTIAKYFPDFVNPEVANAVTIKHLMTHCSGLPDLRQVSNNRDYYMTAKDAGNFDPIKKAIELEFPVGSQFQYSNPAFNGLALIIEQVTGEPWQDFIAREIFGPAGMTRSTITNGSHPSTGVAHAYRTENGNYIEYDYGEFPTFAAAGNGGVWCSVDDLQRYYVALRDHKFLSKELTDESFSIYRPEAWADKEAPANGYSWFIDESKSKFPGALYTIPVLKVGSEHFS